MPTFRLLDSTLVLRTGRKYRFLERIHDNRTEKPIIHKEEEIRYGFIVIHIGKYHANIGVRYISNTNTTHFEVYVLHRIRYEGNRIIYAIQTPNVIMYHSGKALDQYV